MDFKYKISNIPDWVIKVQPKTLLKTEDLASIYGYKNTASMSAMMIQYHEKFPSPDKIMGCGPRGGKTKFWYASTIRKHINETIEKNSS